MDNEGRHIPNRLRKYRKANRYTQRDVANLLGLTGTCQLSRWEQGLSIPSFENLLKLSIIYKTLTEELYYDLRQELCKEISENGKGFKAKNTK